MRSLGLSRGHHCRFRNQPQGPRRAHAAMLAVDQCVGASVATGTVRCVEASCSGPYGSFSTCGSFGRHLCDRHVRRARMARRSSLEHPQRRLARSLHLAAARRHFRHCHRCRLGHRPTGACAPRKHRDGPSVQPRATAEHTVRHPTLRVQSKSTAIFQPSHRRRSVPRSQRAWISPGDYGLDLALQTLRSAFRYLLLILPLISVLFWWQRRHADRMAEAFGKGSPEHEAARRPTVHDWAAGCSIRRARSAAPIPGTSGDRPTGEGLEGLSGGAG